MKGELQFFIHIRCNGLEKCPVKSNAYWYALKFEFLKVRSKFREDNAGQYRAYPRLFTILS